MNESELFGEVIHSYTRQQAIEDGVLIDLTEWASADKGFYGGFTCPVAVTATVWADIKAIPDSHSYQDVRGRAHDLLFMASLTCRKAGGNEGPRLFRLIMHVGRSTYYTAKIVAVPGDNGELVIIIMRPDED